MRCGSSPDFRVTSDITAAALTAGADEVIDESSSLLESTSARRPNRSSNSARTGPASRPLPSVTSRVACFPFRRPSSVASATRRFDAL